MIRADDALLVASAIDPSAADGPHLNKQRWSADDHNTWNDLLSNPAVVITDYVAVFGGQLLPYITSMPAFPAIPNPENYKGKDQPTNALPSNALPGYATAVQAYDVKGVETEHPHENLAHHVDRVYNTQPIERVREDEIPAVNAATGFNNIAYNPYGVTSVGQAQPSYDASKAVAARTIRIQVPMNAAPGAIFNIVDPDTGASSRVQLPPEAKPGAFVDIVIQ
jgi:hypothetical protein